MQSSLLNPLQFVTQVWPHRYLLGQLIMRDVLLRYRGAMFGVLWLFLSPLLMLAIFAFVFGHVFQARWPQQSENMPFWLLLYCGLIAFNIFSETVSRAPASVRSFPSFVKKIVFPVQILPLVPLGSALIHGVFNLLILLAALAWHSELRPQALLLPVLIAPVVLLAVGLAWFVAAWGVFIKDMTQIVPLMVQVLMFMSPVFYPADAAPQSIRPLYALNPLGPTIEACRSAVAGTSLAWGSWGIAFFFCTLTAVLGYAFFRHSQEEFADAL